MRYGDVMQTKRKEGNKGRKSAARKIIFHDEEEKEGKEEREEEVKKVEEDTEEEMIVKESKEKEEAKRKILSKRNTKKRRKSRQTSIPRAKTIQDPTFSTITSAEVEASKVMVLMTTTTPSHAGLMFLPAKINKDQPAV